LSLYIGSISVMVFTCNYICTSLCIW